MGRGAGPGLHRRPDDGNQGTCRGTEWQRVLREDADEARRQVERDYLFLFDNLPEYLGHDPTIPCPTDPTEALPPELVEDRIRAVRNDQLPRPTLELPPGFALPGLRTYLITDHRLDHDLSTTLDLDIAADRWTVDWDAGVVAGSFATPLDPVVLPDVEIRERRAVRTS